MSARSTPAAPSAFFARRRRNYRRFIIPALVVDDDVPSGAGCTQLFVIAGWSPTVVVGLFADAGHSEPRTRRDLALDAARDADRIGRARGAADGAIRVRAARRRYRMAAFPFH